LSTNESDHSHEVVLGPPRSQMVVVGLLTVGLVAALAGVMDPIFWTRKRPLLRWRAALKSPCQDLSVNSLPTPAVGFKIAVT